MIAYAEREFRLNKTMPESEMTYRDHFATVKRMTGVMPEDGENPFDMPEACMHVWDWFLKLVRPPSMEGAPGIPNTEIKAFFEVEGITPQPWEVDAIRRLDTAVIKVINSKKPWPSIS